MKCYTKCRIMRRPCQVKECRLWIDYSDDQNCTEIAVQKEGRMTLKKVGERLKLTPSRIKQLEKEAIAKVAKTFTKLKIL